MYHTATVAAKQCWFPRRAGVGEMPSTRLSHDDRAAFALFVRVSGASSINQVDNDDAVANGFVKTTVANKRRHPINLVPPKGSRSSSYFWVDLSSCGSVV